MIGISRILAKDLFELSGLKGLLLAVVAPASLLLLVGQFERATPPLKLLVAGVPDCSDGARKACRLDALLRQLSTVEIASEAANVHDPLAEMRTRRFDAVLQVNASDPSRSTLYTSTTEPLIAGQLEILADLVTRSALSLSGLAEGQEEQEQNGRKPPRGVAEIAAIASAQSAPFLYYPSARQETVGYLPMTIALIACVLPFTLAAPSLFREREERTLDVLLTVPNVSRVSVFIAKAASPIVVTLISVLLMLVLSQSVYHLGVKAGLLAMIGVLVPALVSSAVLGLAVSATVTSQAQAMLSTTVYLLATVVGGGFLFPIDHGSLFLQRFAMLSPLTYLRPALNTWMFGAGIAAIRIESIVALVIQSAAFATVAALVFRRSMNHL